MMDENRDNNLLGIVLPRERYQKLKRLPDDPENAEVFGLRTEQAEIMFMAFPLPADDTPMQYENPQAIIDGIHSCLGEDQGLIEVRSGKTRAARRYIYSVVKTLKQPSGVQYCLRMHLESGTGCTEIRGFFDECGMTGVRDAIAFEMLRCSGEIGTEDDAFAGWMTDPYDPEYIRGIRMNQSERESFDELFPGHPLSEARRLVRELLEKN